MGLEKVWKDETSRAVEVLGGEPVKYKRMVDDKLILKFTVEEWQKLFNVEDGYVPCNAEWIGYKTTQPIQIYFIRKLEDERL